MKKLKITPYQQASKSARLIRLAIEASRIVSPLSTTYKPRASDVVLNWGTTKNYPFVPAKVINPPDIVKRATNKLISFRLFKEGNVPTPEFTEDKEEAEGWLKESVVICRTLLSSFEGKGIVIATTPEEMVNAPLYTRYKKKKKEFRIHVFNGKVIDIQQKKRRVGVECNNQIRNTAGGWVFCRDGVELPNDASQAAINAVSTLGLDFGAVDIIWNEKENKSFVLEVNTAPGIEGTTVVNYVSAIKEMLNENS